jgi:hypothetical protein
MIIDYLKKKFAKHSDRDLLHEILLNQHFIISKLTIMGDTQTSEAQALEAIATQLTGFGTAIKALQDAVASQDNASPALVQAVTDVSNAAAGLGNLLNPPAPAPAPEPAPAPAQ